MTAWREPLVLATISALIAGAAGTASAASSPLSVAIRDTRAGRVLRHHELRVRLTGKPGEKVTVAADLTTGSGKKKHRVQLVKGTPVTLGSGGRSSTSLPLAKGSAKGLRVILATCRPGSLVVSARAGKHHASRSGRLAAAPGCGKRPKPTPLRTGFAGIARSTAP